MKTLVKIVAVDSLGRVLLLKRANCKRFLNKWELPGGGVEDYTADDYTAEIIRELYEETRLQLSKAHVQEITSVTVDDYEVIVYKTQLTGIPVAQMSDEHFKYVYLSPGNLIKGEFNNCLTPMTVQILADPLVRRYLYKV